MRNKIIAPLLMLAGCSQLPLDPDGTTDRIRETQALRSGLIATGNSAQDASLLQLLKSVADETESKPKILVGSAEMLLPMVETGELDIVVGHLRSDTPWAKRVTILPPPQNMKTTGGELARAAVVRNGENAWIWVVQSHARALTVESR